VQEPGSDAGSDCDAQQQRGDERDGHSYIKTKNLTDLWGKNTTNWCSEFEMLYYFFYLKMHQNALGGRAQAGPAWVAYIFAPDPLAGF